MPVRTLHIRRFIKSGDIYAKIENMPLANILKDKKIFLLRRLTSER